ncbi:PREDICTED: LOW QUALITY PROTEIN: C-C motif chemokine 15-like [Myotis davidii]|uniref:LOW QUALITY PROTEIN: C-C motif chemokine 15-like n=1 Tax=Myotis davidii TaxID=225400 RepID=UPI0007674BDA|nr:PREDICTED: LOW QUALITY PROTEIN: C-C motif chemokine 15-like [Myotis davidii]
MKISAVALSFLILAAALGSPAHGSLASESWDDETRMVMHQLNTLSDSLGIHRPTDCCPSYTSRKIRCIFMESYFVTTSGCSKPAVIFKTKSGQRVCANPNNAEVQDCVMNLNQNQALENLSRIHLSY